jgi:hypothetical protein
VDRNLLYLLIGALLVVLGVISYQRYEERQHGLEIHIGPGGASVHSQ